MTKLPTVTTVTRKSKSEQHKPIRNVCEHGRRKSYCKECGGSAICEHGRQKQRCKECGGSAICEHGRQKPQCMECGGSAICEHGRQKLNANYVNCANMDAKQWTVEFVIKNK